LARKVAEKVPSWISRILLPEIRAIVKEEISSQLKPIDAKISALDSKVEERTNSLESKISALDSKVEERTKALDMKIEVEISSLRNEMVARFDSIEKRLPFIERMALMEARIEKLEKHVGIH